MRRLFALALALLMPLLAYPLGERLRAAAPLSPSAQRLGLGRLSGGVLTGAFRPLLLNYLWLRADILTGKGRLDELALHYRMMVALYPQNDLAKAFLGHLLAYNLKEAAPDPDLAWARAREGLEILADADPGGRAVAHWFLKQCGQNVFDLMRYAGPAWERERRLRAHAEAWGVARYAGAMSRFEIGLAAIAKSDAFFDRVARAHLLAALVVDDWARTGESAHVAEAIAANRWASGPDGFADNPPLALSYAQTARALGELDARAVSDRVLGYGRYDVAVSLWVLGAREGNLALLRAAASAFERYEFHPCPEEKESVARWIAHLEGADGGAPPLPFDAPS